MGVAGNKEAAVSDSEAEVKVLAAPPTLMYLSVVSRDSVRIALLIASLNELEVLRVTFKMPT